MHWSVLQHHGQIPESDGRLEPQSPVQNQSSSFLTGERVGRTSLHSPSSLTLTHSCISLSLDVSYSEPILFNIILCALCLHSYSPLSPSWQSLLPARLLFLFLTFHFSYLPSLFFYIRHFMTLSILLLLHCPHYHPPLTHHPHAFLLSSKKKSYFCSLSMLQSFPPLILLFSHQNSSYFFLMFLSFIHSLSSFSHCAFLFSLSPHHFAFFLHFLSHLSFPPLSPFSCFWPSLFFPVISLWQHIIIFRSLKLKEVKFRRNSQLRENSAFQ